MDALLAQAEGLNPAGQSALDGGVRDIVVDAHAARIGVVEHFAQADDGGAGVGHAGMGVVNGHHAMAGVELASAAARRRKSSSCGGKGRAGSYWKPSQR